MAQTPWCGDDLELAGPSDQIPYPPIQVGMSYDFGTIYCCSPPDFVTRILDREEQYVVLKTDLAKIYQELPLWLRIRQENARKMTPISYVDSYKQTGRGYAIVHETSPELVVFDVDEGIYQDVNIENVFYLEKDHVEISAFAIK